MAENHEPDESAGRRPLPPDDRLWRHPSELSSGATTPSPEQSGQQSNRSWKRRPHGFGVALAVGAVAAAGVVVALDTSGAMRDRNTTTVELATATTSSAVPTLSVVRGIVPDIDGVAWIDIGTSQAPIPGIVIDDRGHIMTSATSMIAVTPMAVKCAGDDTDNVRLVGVDRRHNIAVLATDKPGWPIASVNTVRLRVGEKIELLFHGDNGSTPDFFATEVRRMDAAGTPSVSWPGGVDQAAIAVGSGGTIVALLDGADGEGINITDALRSARSIIARGDGTTSTTRR